MRRVLFEQTEVDDRAALTGAAYRSEPGPTIAHRIEAPGLDVVRHLVDAVHYDASRAQTKPFTKTD